MRQLIAGSSRIAIHLGIVVATLWACSEAPTDRSTSEHAKINLAKLRGRVLDLDGAPLDSFRIVGSVPDSTWFYSVASIITSGSGNYSLQLRRLYTGPADSALVTVTATSTKDGDRTTDGINQTFRETVWLPFVASSDTVTSRSRDIVVPFRRR